MSEININFYDKKARLGLMLASFFLIALVALLVGAMYGGKAVYADILSDCDAHSAFRLGKRVYACQAYPDLESVSAVTAHIPSQ